MKRRSTQTRVKMGCGGAAGLGDQREPEDPGEQREPEDLGEQREPGEPGEGCSTCPLISMLWHWGYQGDKKKGVKTGGKKGSGCEGREKKKKKKGEIPTGAGQAGRSIVAIKTKIEY